MFISREQIKNYATQAWIAALSFCMGSFLTQAFFGEKNSDAILMSFNLFAYMGINVIFDQIAEDAANSVAQNSSANATPTQSFRLSITPNAPLIIKKENELSTLANLLIGCCKFLTWYWVALGFDYWLISHDPFKKFSDQQEKQMLAYACGLLVPYAITYFFEMGVKKADCTNDYLAPLSSKVEKPLKYLRESALYQYLSPVVIEISNWFISIAVAEKIVNLGIPWLKPSNFWLMAIAQLICVFNNSIRGANFVASDERNGRDYFRSGCYHATFAIPIGSALIKAQHASFVHSDLTLKHTLIETLPAIAVGRLADLVLSR